MDGSGYYVASLDKHGKRVTASGLFARGNGSWKIDDSGLTFLRTLTREPIRIPRDSIRSVGMSRSSWWGGKWLLGAKTVEVVWSPDGAEEITSGFIFSGKPEDNSRAAEALSAANGSA